ncbi:DUF4386 domain-containing protein [Flagellimonas aquimarina]|jgi:hypothetical protein|uniref:DUF4386 domain-containing protein n=1 Tax=Flagellimonas aquimarina TaxID=2201895 RepID=A0A316L5V1_9FLAO|nr:DUF4386 domain-containing protein [Allomuricauda koreensis]PWL39643.1 DUF4386 domain-containing protein [Allomuricauda koreensis]
MGPNKKTAHLAGLLYFLVVITGIFSLLYVPSQLIVWSNPAETVENIKSSESLFRLEILSGLLCYIFFLLLPWVLYKLFKEINKSYAVLMVVLAVISVPISFISLTHKLDILSLLSDAEYLTLYSPEQIQAQVMLALESYHHGNLVAQAFWGLWLFPFGYLVFRSGFLPKFLGVFLMVGSCGYFLDFAGRIAYSNYSELWLSDYITIPASIGEIGTCLWLLIMGIKTVVPIAKDAKAT